MPRLLIVDSNAILFKAHFAFGTRQLKNSKGMTTSALYGFLKAIFQLLKDFEPDRLCFAFDTSRDTFRREMYPEYKAHRSETPPELKEQLPIAPRLARALGAKTLAIDGFEADDILGTLSKMAVQECQDTEVLIVTGDRDAFQLIEERIHIGYTSSKASKGVEIVDLKGFSDRYDGLVPEDLITIKALMGDSSDNIPGIKGIGEKTAIKLVHSYKTLEGLYEHVEDLKGKMKEKVETGREDAFLSRTLATIREDVPIDLGLDDFNYQFAPTEDLRDLLIELEFHSFLKEIGAAETRATEAPAPREVEKNYRLITKAEDLKTLCERIQKAGICALDTETTSLNTHEARLAGISLSLQRDEAVYIPVGHRALGSKNLPLKEVQTHLGPLLENPEILWIAHNWKYDLGILRGHSLPLPKNIFDTMLAAHLLYPEGKIGLKDLATGMLGEPRESFEEVAGKNGDFSMLVPEQGLNYAASDADNTLALYELFLPELKKRPQIQKLMENIELPLIPILESMESRGITISKTHFESLARELEKESSRLTQAILEKAGEEINLNSPKQLATILFEKLGIPHGKKTKTGYSTANDVLEELAPHWPICGEILEYRHMQKLLNTYALPLQQAADSRSRIHTTFNQTVVATGRLSSNHPNLQNIPVRTAWGNRIREGFLPQDGHTLVSIDYSQIELRMMAHMAKDKAMIEAFEAGRDIHTETAARIFDRSAEEITKQERESAKAINFGIIYGISPFGLSRQLNIQIALAKGFIESYFKVYSGIEAFMNQISEQAEKDGYVTTLCGRERPIADIQSKNKNRRDAGRRVAINTSIQGSAAEILKLSMIEINQLLSDHPAHMLLQVHDELIFEVPDTELSIVLKIRDIMQNIYPLAVPLVCDVETGPSWGELKAYDC